MNETNSSAGHRDYYVRLADNTGHDFRWEVIEHFSPGVFGKPIAKRTVAVFLEEHEAYKFSALMNSESGPAAASPAAVQRAVARYPQGKCGGVENSEIMREACDKWFANGGVLYLPSNCDEHGNRKWDVWIDNGDQAGKRVVYTYEEDQNHGDKPSGLITASWEGGCTDINVDVKALTEKAKQDTGHPLSMVHLGEGWHVGPPPESTMVPTVKLDMPEGGWNVAWPNRSYEFQACPIGDDCSAAEIESERPTARCAACDMNFAKDDLYPMADKYRTQLYCKECIDTGMIGAGK